MKEAKTLKAITIYVMAVVTVMPFGTAFFSVMFKTFKFGIIALIINLVAIVIVEICGSFALKEIRRQSETAERCKDNGEETVNEKSEKDKE